MSDAGAGEELLRWGLEVDGLNAEATRLGSRMERVLRGARKAVERAQAQLDAVSGRLDPSDEQARRIEEVARASIDAAVRTDLLALNFQVEAARLGEDDRGLEKVAHEIRTLSDRGARGAAEISDLAGSLGRDTVQARGAIAQGVSALERALEEVERAVRSADAAAGALARARGAAAEFAAGVTAAARRPEGGLTPADHDAVRRLAAAIEVRDATIDELARATAARLWRTHHALLDEANVAKEGARRLEAQLGRLHEMVGLVEDADEIARRAKHLALNADLAATRSEDPAFVLFAEEARRLSEQADTTANQTQSQLDRARKSLGPEISRGRTHTDALRSLAAELAELLDRFGGAEPDEEEEHDDLERAWREDRAAAEQLAEARAKWVHGEENEQGT